MSWLCLNPRAKNQSGLTSELCHGEAFLFWSFLKLMGPKLSIACVKTCVSRPPSIIQPG